MASAALNNENFDEMAFTFRDRQAGVAVVYDPFVQKYYYNAYCLEKKLMKELFTCEYDFLEDALNVINEEFGSWDLTPLSPKDTGCGNCAAK